MTISSDNNKSGPYIGNGVTTVFDYEFQIVAEEHISVIKTDADGVEATLTLDSDYSVTGVGDPSGGQTILNVAPLTGEMVTLLLNVPFTQDVDLENQGAYYAETVERALDLAVQRDLQLREELTRAVKLPASEDPALLPQLVENIQRLYKSVDEVDTLVNSLSGLLRSDIATTRVHLNAFTSYGYSTLGDMGAGARYFLGSDDGPDARQDALGAWYQLDLNGNALDIGWFGGVPGDQAKTDAAITAAEAVLVARGGGAIRFRGPGWVFTSQRKPAAGVRWHFDGPISSTQLTNEWGTINSQAAENFYMAGPHVGERRIARHLNVNVFGSGTDLSATGDNAFEITIQKNNWRDPALAQSGEFAGMVVHARQGGPATGSQNSVSGYGADIGTVTGAGFACQWEGVTTQFGLPADGTPIDVRQVYQFGIINSRTGTRIGGYHQAVKGTMETGTYYRSESAGRWGDIIRSSVGAIGDWSQFKASDVGKLTWNQANDNTKIMSLEVNSAGTMAWRRGNPATDLLATIDQVGVFTVKDSIGIGIDGYGDRNAYIDFNAADGFDYNSRLIRSPGVNGTLELLQQGTGALRLRQLGGGQVHMTGTGGYIHNVTGTIQYGLFNEADNSGSSFASNVFQGTYAGTHNGQSWFNTAIRHRPPGSGTNGPQHADYALGISLIKQNWGTTTVGGEIDGAYFVVRQGGPDVANNSAINSSDCSCWLGDIQNIGPSGFAAVFEAAVSNINRGDYQINKAVRIQAGVINTTLAGQQSYGYLAIADVGVHDAGYQVQNGTASSWAAYFKAVGGTGNTLRFQITDTNYVFNLDGWITNNTKDIAKVSNHFWQAYSSALTVTGSFTIDLTSHLARLIRLPGSAAATVTLAKTAREGWWCEFVLDGANAATFSPEAGATMAAKSGHTKLSAQYGCVKVQCVANSDGSSAVFRLTGDTSA